MQYRIYWYLWIEQHPRTERPPPLTAPAARTADRQATVSPNEMTLGDMNMSIKRTPDIKYEHRLRYERISKADIVEAFRDLFREFGGVDEQDDTVWMAELEYRVALLKSYRTGQPIDSKIEAAREAALNAVEMDSEVA
jgi:hypothetical protein